jgi:hypothetical protein
MRLTRDSTESNLGCRAKLLVRYLTVRPRTILHTIYTPSPARLTRRSTPTVVYQSGLSNLLWRDITRKFVLKGGPMDLGCTKFHYGRDFFRAILFRSRFQVCDFEYF